jgi:branched-chain amino acid transport system substrate-binding protein
VGSISATAPDYTAQCVAVQQAHATSLFVGDIAAVIKRVAADCNTQGYQPLNVFDGEEL